MKKSGSFKVNTILVGAGRSGTTSFCDALASDSSVCFSTIKEVNYFSIADLYERGEKYFHSFFDHKGEAVVATADTYLLSDEEAIDRIYRYNPEMRIIVLLRDPVRRAYSSYNYSVNYGHHEAYDGFLSCIEKEKGIENESDIVRQNNFGHFYGSLYHAHISKWVKVFGREQVLLLTTEQMKLRPKELSEALGTFLGIEDLNLQFDRHNKNAVPRSKVVERLFIDRDNFIRRSLRQLTPSFLKRAIINSGVVDKLQDANRKAEEAQPLSDAHYRVAFEYFHEDMQKLEEEFGLAIRSQSDGPDQPR